MSKVMLNVRGLTTKYVTRFHEDVYAVDHVSLTIEEGKSLGIAGESGCVVLLRMNWPNTMFAHHHTSSALISSSDL